MGGNLVQSNKVVVILTPGFPKDEEDSTCIPTLYEYIDTMRREKPDFKVIVLAFQYPFRKGWDKWHGIDVYSANGKNSKYLFKLRTWFRIYRELKRLHKEYEIHAIHSFWLTETAFLAQFFSSNKKIKHIATLFGQDALPTNKYLRLLDLNKMTVVAISEFVSKKLEKTTGKSSDYIIHFGLNPELRHLSHSPNRIYDIIGVGSLIELKNYTLFVSIIAELKIDFPTIRAIIIGEGVDRKKIQKLIATKNLEANIYLAGELPRDEVLNYMQQSKIFLHTSRYESAGYVFLESLSCGCELVSFEVGYAPTSEKVHRCQSKREMTSCLKVLLNQELNFTPVSVQSMSETVQKFSELYAVR